MKSSYHKQISRSIHPIQIDQTEDNELVTEGLDIIETLASSETSPSILILTSIKTVLLTTVLTSTVHNNDKTLSLCELMLYIYFQIGSLTAVPSVTLRSRISTVLTNYTRSYTSIFTSPTSLTTQSSNFSRTMSTMQLFTSSSVSSASMILTSSALSSIDTPGTPMTIPPSSNTAIQPLATSTDPPVNTVLPVSPPASSCYACPPSTDYVDVPAKDVLSKIATFIAQVPQNCSIYGFAYEFPADLVNYDVGYNMSISLLPFCSDPSTSTCEDPLSDYSSSDVLWGAWRNCK